MGDLLSMLRLCHEVNDKERLMCCCMWICNRPEDGNHSKQCTHTH